MNGVHANGKVQTYENSIPGCLGMMVNLFDFASSTPGNRLLTEKPHRYGSPTSRSRSDVSRLSSSVDDETEEKTMVSELRESSSGKDTGGTPVKMLIAKEMSKDLESTNHPPNVVAKLMGLDALPQPHVLDLAPQMSHSMHCSRNSHPESLASFFMHENSFFNRDISSKVHEFHEQNECRDVHEIWLHPPKTNSLRDASPWKGRYQESSNEKKMNLVRQKFMELKRLAMDENRHESKEFHDALEVLNSHKDEFVTLLHEQNSMLCQHLYMGHSIPSPGETKRITVLRPSKLVFDEKFSASGKNHVEQVKQEAKLDLPDGQDDHHNGCSPLNPALRSDSSHVQPTRIVVLKPNARNVHDLRAAVSSAPSSPINSHLNVVTSLTPSSPRHSRDRSFFKQLEDDEAREASEVAKEITQQMRANLAGLRRDETLISSVFSSGYNGDESSFNKSEAEYTTGYLSDSEAMSPTSRHSWDYANRENSPHSSSFNRTVYVPKSSVCKEAKKRLSERWAMTSGTSNHDNKLTPTGSSTLGEMLALSDVLRPGRFEHGECSRNQGPRGSTSCVDGHLGNEESITESPRSLQRSKSLPLQSTAYSGGLTIDGPEGEVCTTGNPKDSGKMKTTKLSFAAKVTSLFLPRIKKSSKENSGKSPPQQESGTQAAAIPGSPAGQEIAGNDELKKNSVFEEGSMCSFRSPSCSVSPAFKQSRGATLEQVGLDVPKPAAYGLPGENQDQPSPISVLDPPFEEDDNTILVSFSSIGLNRGKQLPPVLGRSNLIDKSPPIGSIARSLSWDDHSRDPTSCYPSKSIFPSPGVEEEEDEWLFLVQSLLSAACLDNPSKSGSIFSGWHSLESPLDPTLREKYIDLTIKEPLHEAKRRQLRSNSKLVFDFVNATLIEAAKAGSSCLQSHSCATSGDCTEMPISADDLWALMKEWVFGDVRSLSADCGDDGEEAGVVGRVVMREVVSKGWADELRLEVDKIGKEIEGKLLEELVKESVTELTASTI